MRRALVTCFLLCAVIALVALPAYSRRTQDPKPGPFASVRTELDEDLRFGGYTFSKQEMRATDVVKRGRDGERELESLDVSLPPQVRLPRDTLGGKAFFASVGKNSFTVYYDNGLSVVERWGERAGPFLTEKCTAAGHVPLWYSSEIEGVRAYATAGLEACIKCHSCDSQGDQNGAFWNTGDTKLAVTSSNHGPKELLNVMESMRREQSAPRYSGFFGYEDLSGRIKLLRGSNADLGSLDELRRRSPMTRFAAETLGGKVAYVGLGRNDTGGQATVVYDNGIELTERWTVGDDLPRQRGETLPPSPDDVPQDAPGQVQHWLLEADGVRARAHQKGPIRSFDIEQNPSTLMWRRGGVEYFLTAYDVWVEDLVVIADSMQ